MRSADHNVHKWDWYPSQRYPGRFKAELEVGLDLKFAFWTKRNPDFTHRKNPSQSMVQNQNVIWILCMWAKAKGDEATKEDKKSRTENRKQQTIATPTPTTRLYYAHYWYVGHV